MMGLMSFMFHTFANARRLTLVVIARSAQINTGTLDPVKILGSVRIDGNNMLSVRAGILGNVSKIPSVAKNEELHNFVGFLVRWKVPFGSCHDLVLPATVGLL